MAITSMCAAQDVPASVSRKAAVNFWNTYHTPDTKSIDQSVPQLMTANDLPMLHIYAIGDNGFVIVAAAYCVQPILAYSFNSPATEYINPEVRFWLEGYNEQIEFAIRNGQQSSEADSLWNHLLNAPIPVTPVNIISVPEMLTTHWDQGDPYNRFCPYDSVNHDRAVVGCVATAMAQIMKYWNHPSTGTGSHSFTHVNWHDESNSFGEISADFGHTTYMWDYMPNTIDNITTANRYINAVATLSFHCGVAVDMMYGISAQGGSGAYSSCGFWATACAENAFRDYFKYSPNSFYMERNTTVTRDSMAFDTVTMDSVLVHYSYDSIMIPDSQWAALIDTNLAHNAPIYYDGSDRTGGHAFVLDGADEQGRYHFNWGWSGHYNGFFAFNNLALGGGGTGSNATYTFNRSQGAIFGIEPLPEHFDTVTIFDTICRGQNNYVFHDYYFPATDSTYQAVWLDTVFNINLTIINIRRLFISPNGGEGSRMEIPFCPTEGVVLPECTYHRSGHIFIGWGFASCDNDTIYQPNTWMPLRSNKTIYAIWEDTTYHPDPQDTVSIELVDGGFVTLSPNPTTDIVNFSTTSAEDIQISIIDTYGRVLISEKVIAGKAKISLRRLPAGTYVVLVATADTIYKNRIIKL